MVFILTSVNFLNICLCKTFRLLNIWLWGRSSSSDWSAYCSLNRILWHSKKRILPKKCQWVEGGGCPENQSKTLLRPSLLVLENAKIPRQKNPQNHPCSCFFVSVVFEVWELCAPGVAVVAPAVVAAVPVADPGLCGYLFYFCPLDQLYFQVQWVAGFYPKWWIQLLLNSELTLPLHPLNLVWPTIIPVPCLCLQSQGIFLHLLTACFTVL